MALLRLRKTFSSLTIQTKQGALVNCNRDLCSLHLRVV